MATTSEILSMGEGARAWLIAPNGAEYEIQILGPIQTTYEVPEDDPRAGHHQLCE